MREAVEFAPMLKPSCAMNPYAMPHTTTDAPASSAKEPQQRAWRFVLGGLVATVAPFFIGLIATVVSLIRTFQALSAASIPAADRQLQLSKGISAAMHSTLLGVIGSALGFGFLIIALIHHSRTTAALKRT